MVAPGADFCGITGLENYFFLKNTGSVEIEMGDIACRVRPV